jgi:hypothetical protein
MTKGLISVSWVVICGLSIGGDVLACGDKYFVPSRTTRFERAPVPREQAAILLYANPTSELSRRIVSLSVAEALRKAGYEPTLAATAQELASAMRGRMWDLVVIDVADIRMIGGSERGAPAVLPVTYTMTGSEWSQAKRQYPGIVKAPTKAHTFVDVVDAALESQRAARKSTRQ